MRETICPLCERPRPPGATRCLCNYAFEYDATGRAGGRAAPAGAGMIAAALAVAAAAGVAAFLWMRTQPGTADRAGLGLGLVLAGAFSVAGGLLDWGWFLGARRARLVGAILGRAGARLFYAALGGALIGAGAVLA